MSKEQAIAEILYELYTQGKWTIKGGVIHVETQSAGGAQEDNKTNSRKRRDYSVIAGSKGTSGDTQ